MKLAGLMLAVLGLFAGSAAAQPYPSRPINVVGPVAAGSSIDVITRIVLEEIQKRTGATFIVEAKPGALGAIASDTVGRAPPDGYTLMPSSSATHSSGPQLARWRHDALRDFTQLGGVARFDLVLVTRGQGGPKTVAELTEAGRQRGLFYGYGSGTGQIGSSAVARAAKIEAQGVSYRGQPLAVNDLLGGRIDFVVSDAGAVAALVREGGLNALGTLGDRRSTLFPDLPTLTEAGLPVTIVGWLGMAGPARLPDEVRAWWATQLATALASPAVVERMRGLGFDAYPEKGEAFDAFVRRQYETWGRHIREAGITPE